LQLCLLSNLFILSHLTWYLNKFYFLGILYCFLILFVILLILSYLICLNQLFNNFICLFFNKQPFASYIFIILDPLSILLISAHYIILVLTFEFAFLLHVFKTCLSHWFEMYLSLQYVHQRKNVPSMCFFTCSPQVWIHCVLILFQINLI
jgi:hypothetical protein